jgi:hypothetical protein
MITKLIRLSVETGSVTGQFIPCFSLEIWAEMLTLPLLAVFATVDAVLLLAFKADFFVTVSYGLAKLYTNSFMMILNSRINITNGRISGRASASMSAEPLAAKDPSLATLSYAYTSGSDLPSPGLGSFGGVGLGGGGVYSSGQLQPKERSPVAVAFPRGVHVNLGSRNLFNPRGIEVQVARDVESGIQF